MNALTALRCPLAEDDWRALGLAGMQVGHVLLETGEPGWGFEEVLSNALPVPTWGAPLPPSKAPPHPNAVTGIDHIVLVVPSLDDADTAIRDALGLPLRRRSAPRGAPMAFYRAGEAILEVVQRGGGPLLWGVALRTSDIETTVSLAGGLVGPSHPAIQGGRMASTVRTWSGFAVGFYEK